MPEISPTNRVVVLQPGERVELVRLACDCPEGTVCPDDGLFADACPRRPNPPVEIETAPDR